MRGVFLLSIACSKDFLSEKYNNTLSVSRIKYDEKLNTMCFNSNVDIQNFMDHYDDSQNELNNLYSEGFVPMSVTDNVDIKTFESIQLRKSEMLNMSVYDIANNEEDEAFIHDERFSSILNAKGEVVVDNKLYRYTRNGLYITDKENVAYLDDYISNNANQTLPISLNRLNEKIETYIPDKSKFEDLTIVGAESSYSNEDEIAYNN